MKAAKRRTVPAAVICFAVALVERCVSSGSTPTPTRTSPRFSPVCRYYLYAISSGLAAFFRWSKQCARWWRSLAPAYAQPAARHLAALGWVVPAFCSLYLSLRRHNNSAAIVFVLNVYAAIKVPVVLQCLACSGPGLCRGGATPSNRHRWYSATVL